METDPSRADAVKRALTCATKCNQLIVEELALLLGHKSKASTKSRNNPSAKRADGRIQKPLTVTKPPRGRGKSAPRVEILEDRVPTAEPLTSAQTSRLATEIVNETLKVLTQAVKASSARKASSQETGQDLIPAELCREGTHDTPQPLRSRPINHTTSTPSGKARLKKPDSAATDADESGLAAIADCSRLAFASLRKTQVRDGIDSKVPPLQLETGMSVLVGKLIALGLENRAGKELDILIRRLCPPATEIETTDRNNDSSSQGSQESQDIADLLRIASIPGESRSLALLVSSQLQVLKLLTKRRNPKSIEIAMGHMEISKPASITHCLDKLVTSSGLKDGSKRGHQTEQAASLIGLLCGKSIRKESVEVTENSMAVPPECSFRLCVLSLTLRLRNWKLTGQYEDCLKDAWSRCIDQIREYDENSLLDSKRKYQFLKCVLHPVLDQAEEAYPHKLARPHRLMLSEIYKKLSELASSIGALTTAGKWSERWVSQLHELEASSAMLCTALCHAACLYAKVWLGGSKDVDLLKPLTAAVDALGGDLSGTPNDFNVLLSMVAGLRKASLGILQYCNRHDDDGKIKGLFAKLTELSKQVVHLSVRTLCKVLGKESSYSTTLDSIQSHRLALVGRLMPGTFEALGALCRAPYLAANESVNDLEQSLNRCTIVASTMDSLLAAHNLDFGHGFCKTFVTISNSYWCLYLSLQGTSESSRCKTILQIATSLLQDRPAADREVGILHIKFERLSILYESQNNPAKAMECATQSLLNALEFGLLDEATALSDSLPLSRIQAQSEKMRIFSRPLAVHTRSWLSLAGDGPSNQMQVVTNCQGVSIRGIVLELQLNALLNLLQDKLFDSRSSFYLDAIAKELLELYSTEQFPIRRLRVVAQLLRAELSGAHLSESAQGLSSAPAASSQDLGSDSRLAQYKSHLVAQCKVYQIIKAPEQDLAGLEEALNLWQSLVVERTTWATLLQSIDEPVLFISQLDSLGEFLSMQGLEIQRLQTLHILSRVHALNEAFNVSLYVSRTCALALQLTRLGHSGKAEAYFQKTQPYLDSTSLPPVISVQWYLGYAEYLHRIGNTSKCHEAARKLLEAFASAFQQPTTSSRPRDRYNRIVLSSELMNLQSLIAPDFGSTAGSIYYARQSLKLAYRAWALLERQYSQKPKALDACGSGSESLTDGMASLSISQSRPVVLSNKHDSLKSSPFWPLVPRLFQRLIDLSSLLSSEGLLQEAEFYVENAKRIADTVKARCFQNHASIVKASYEICSGDVAAGKSHLEAMITDSAVTSSLQQSLHVHLAKAHELNNDLIAADQCLLSALESLEATLSANVLPGQNRHKLKVEKLTNDLNEIQVANKAPRVTKSRKPTSSRPKKTTVTPLTNTVEAAITGLSDCLPTWRCKSYILRQRCRLAVRAQDASRADLILSDLQQFPASPMDRMRLDLTQSEVWLHRGLRSLSLDPVFSLLLESTISCPAASYHTQNRDEEVTQRNLEDIEPRKKDSKPTAAASKRAKAKQLSRSQDTIEFLDRAFRVVYQAQGHSQSLLPLADLHTMTDIWRKSLMMLSSTASAVSSPVLTAYAMEMSRSVAFMRESSTIAAERLLGMGSEDAGYDAIEVPHNLSPHPLDAKTFQEQFIDIIPYEWSVISIGLSEDKEELLLSKIRSGQEPFILTIPLQRNKLGAREEESFTFGDGKLELKEIIDLANFSTHDAGDMTRKGAKNEWWEARAALDARLKDLLINIQNIWLGGFRGLLSQHNPRTDLLARFEKTFDNILDKHLPSRRRGGRKPGPDQVTLDSKVLELFVGLAKPANHPELDESVMDLLYFVVDILQFHGERNAYDEIDFDPMVLEVMDALSHYHEAAKEHIEADYQHTILILDKALHSFPWESLPALSGQAVSRLPSLTCLRDRILSQRDTASGASSQHISVDSTNGAYILNPSGDLSATQSTFVSSLGALTTWKASVKTAPKESEIIDHLSTCDVYLYFGHGSGSQYARARKIRQLERCAVSLLMGCSSGTMTEAGEFESYGTPLTYLHAGAPAVMGTLWDVTDKDIDRFSMDVLEKWGLIGENGGSGKENTSPVERKAKGKASAKSKLRQQSPETRQKSSLDRAVADSRDSCIFRYLNGAAPVIYGVPVFLR